MKNYTTTDYLVIAIEEGKFFKDIKFKKDKPRLIKTKVLHEALLLDIDPETKDPLKSDKAFVNEIISLARKKGHNPKLAYAHVHRPIQSIEPSLN